MKLTGTQTAALEAAAARDDGSILPLPASIRGGAIGKVCDALEAKGLASKIGEAGKQTLVINDDGRRALGLEIKPAAVADAKPPQKGRSSRPSAGSPTPCEVRSPARSRRSSTFWSGRR